MSEPPKIPTSALIAWSTVVSAIVGLVLLVRSHEPAVLKVVVVGLAVLGTCGIIIFELGSWRERIRLKRRIEALERERQDP